jgi:phosphatidate phosphatase APP1
VACWSPGEEWAILQQLLDWLNDPLIPFFLPDFNLFFSALHASATDSIPDQPPGS